MNIGKFKRIVNTWENSEENFRLFRIWAENCYVLYEKYYNLEMAEANQVPIDPDKINEIEYDWTGIDYHDAVMTYSEMGWKLDEKIEGAKMSHDKEWDYFYYDVTFPYIYEKIKALKDNVEFGYAILSIVRTVNTNRKLYIEFVNRLHKGLKEHNLFSAMDLIEIEQEKKAFIAMSFDVTMEKARKAIMDSVQHCGYIPMLIDIKEHNNQIVPEIYKEICDSEFVIADLTGQRGGVYYEAGYAVARGKDLILCCKKGENPHFDVAQINTIFWKNELDLKERLAKRIKATIGINDYRD